MENFFSDYYWDRGTPYGKGPFLDEGEGYKIVSDPYGKWISVEKYIDSSVQVVYDSRFLDFRKLQPSEQLGWERTVILETADEMHCLIRNQDDRVVFLEKTEFSESRCRRCTLESAHGILVSIHRMHYTDEGDAFDGVVLLDANAHPVMMKRYTFDMELGQYTKLEEEIWNLEKLSNDYV